MRLRLRTVLLATVLVLTGCASEPALPTLPPDVEPKDQGVTWKGCDQGFECAEITAPLDWTENTGEFISLKLMRPLGSDQLEPILLNPGGPGSSAISWMRDNFENIGSDWFRDNYQAIAFDPRGVGESTAVFCSDPALKDNVLYGISEFPFGSAEDVAASERAAAEFAASCQVSGPSVSYFSTQQTARDMDLIRELLGQTSLNYLGFSYGTELGATYIALFPQNVGKFVLDGAVDPTMDSNTKLLGQVIGFDKALRAYLADCLRQDFCPFTSDVESAMNQISGFMQAREVTPLPTDDEERELGISATLAGIIVTLYAEASWRYLSQAFDAAFQGDGSIFLLLADFYNDRNPNGGYLTNINEANAAIRCADEATKPVGPDLTAEIIAASKVFGKYFAYPAEDCIGWPSGRGVQELDFRQQLDTAPIVIGTTGDPATPYSQAVTLAELLGGKLLTLEGEGHTAYGDNGCIDSLVDSYLAGGDLGTGNLTCF